MLESTIALARGPHQKNVPGHRRWPAEEIDVPGAEPRQVGLQPLAVRIRQPGQHQGMRHPGRQELHRSEWPHEHRMIDQLAIPGGPKRTELTLPTGEPLEPR